MNKDVLKELLKELEQKKAEVEVLLAKDMVTDHDMESLRESLFELTNF